MTKVVLAIHGGAFQLATKKAQYPGRKPFEMALANALRAGQKVLTKGGSAIRAVTAATTVLEDCELFNAGKGAVLCQDGFIELCASIMNGANLSTGAMTGLKRVKNPVLAAQSLLKHSHGLMFGEMAEAFAEKMGVEMVPPEYFLTAHRKEQWEKHKNKQKAVMDRIDYDFPLGTVGAVARDCRGNLAAATSTGGMVNQLAGRIGDSPIIGSGTWADNKTCAISATGNGDAFARIVFARRVADLIELDNITPETAALRSLTDVARVGGQGGCILIDTSGQITLPFTTRHMPRGWVVGKENPRVAILPDEEVEIPHDIKNA